jgi:DNA-binding PadR family transcriptional regulator
MPKHEPYDQESEQAILAALMSEKNIYKQIDLTIDDFYDKQHQHIYKIIIELSEEGLEPEYVAVSAKIKSLGLTGTIAPGYIYDLCDKIPGAMTKNWKNYVAIIKKKSAGRKLYFLSQHLQKVSQNGLNDLSGKIEDALKQLIEIKEKADNKRRGITEQVSELVATSNGLILTSTVHRELCLTSRDLKKQANEAIRRLAEEGILTPCGDKHGCYRKVEGCEEIDWLSADIDNVYPIKWPFQLENLVTIFPGNIIIVAGEKNAGKSAFLYNLIKLNQSKHKIYYFNSESGKEEMKLRLSKFDDLRLTDWKFKAYSRSGNFPEAIHPDRLNIIDYFEVTDDFFKIGGEIRQIHDRLKKGICVIALQKAGNAEYGRGGDFSREKSRLYITMGKGKLKIVDGKIWASDVNPNGVVIDYKLVNGAKFIETGGSLYGL